MMILQALSDMTPGAMKMARTDPHGWTLTAVSIIVVFGALLILYIVYSVIGELCMNGFSVKKDDEGPRKAAAAAVALYLSEQESLPLHGDEKKQKKRVITITPSRGAWGEVQRNFRKYPGR